MITGRRVDPMAIRYLALLAVALVFAAAGYFLFGAVVAIHAGLWLHGVKMYYAQGFLAQLFGATGAVLGVLLAWGVWRPGVAALGRRVPP